MLSYYPYIIKFFLQIYFFHIYIYIYIYIYGVCVCVCVCAESEYSHLFPTCTSRVKNVCNLQFLYLHHYFTYSFFFFWRSTYLRNIMLRFGFSTFFIRFTFSDVENKYLLKLCRLLYTIPSLDKSLNPR